MVSVPFVWGAWGLWDFDGSVETGRGIEVKIQACLCRIPQYFLDADREVFVATNIFKVNRP
jgi:hypothetical protein